MGSNYNKGTISRPQNAKAPQNRASPERARAAVASRPRQIRGDGERAGEKKFSSWCQSKDRRRGLRDWARLSLFGFGCDLMLMLFVILWS